MTGATDELIYVSPKTGRAVSRAAGEPWKERLLPLPGFLRGDRDAPRPLPTSATDCGSAAFFDRFLLGPRGLALPDSRARILAHLEAAAIG